MSQVSAYALVAQTGEPRRGRSSCTTRSWDRAGNVASYEADLRTSLPRKLHFSTDDKLIEMAKRGRALKDLADRQALEMGMAKGKGAITLSLTQEQCAKLTK